MRKLIILVTFLNAVVLGQAQYVGIGTSTPAYPLTVVASEHKGITQKDGAVEIGFYTATTAAYLQTWTNHALHFATNNGTAQLTLATNGMFGVGTTTPSTRLHVIGNTSLMGELGVGTTTPSTKLHVIGNTSLIGNVGINTTSPTTELDINGDIRIRGSFPKTGSVLTSADANGNASWADPLAFKATGGYNGAATPMTKGVWTKVFFNQTLSYNLGLAFQTVNSQFVAPEKGIYHFDAQIQWGNLFQESGIRIMASRGGNLFLVAEKFNQQSLSVDNGVNRFQYPSSISADASLEAGDIVWIEGYYQVYAGGPPNNITASSIETWFNGHLITRY